MFLLPSLYDGHALKSVESSPGTAMPSSRAAKRQAPPPAEGAYESAYRRTTVKATVTTASVRIPPSVRSRAYDRHRGCPATKMVIQCSYFGRCRRTRRALCSIGICRCGHDNANTVLSASSQNMGRISVSLELALVPTRMQFQRKRIT